MDDSGLRGGKSDVSLLVYKMTFMRLYGVLPLSFRMHRFLLSIGFVCTR